MDAMSETRATYNTTMEVTDEERRINTWIRMLENGAHEIREIDRELKQIYTDQMNDGMAFGL